MTEPRTASRPWKGWLEAHVVTVAVTGAVALMAAVVLGVIALGRGTDGTEGSPPATSRPTQTAGTVSAPPSSVSTPG
ncbi:MAG: hypothetical protein WB239_08195, partial [Acidimicrobiia bacterium]